MREREIRIGSQRLIERSRRFNPHVVVQIGESLIVIPLRILGRRSRIVMGSSNARPNRYGTLEHVLRNRRDRVRRVLRERNRRKEEYKEKREAQDIILSFPPVFLATGYWLLARS